MCQQVPFEIFPSFVRFCAYFTRKWCSSEMSSFGMLYNIQNFDKAFGTLHPFLIWVMLSYHVFFLDLPLSYNSFHTLHISM